MVTGGCRNDLFSNASEGSVLDFWLFIKNSVSQLDEICTTSALRFTFGVDQTLKNPLNFLFLLYVNRIRVDRQTALNRHFPHWSLVGAPAPTFIYIFCLCLK